MRRFFSCVLAAVIGLGAVLAGAPAEAVPTHVADASYHAHEHTHGGVTHTHWHSHATASALAERRPSAGAERGGDGDDHHPCGVMHRRGGLERAGWFTAPTTRIAPSVPIVVRAGGWAVDVLREARWFGGLPPPRGDPPDELRRLRTVVMLT